ncbi:MAG: hypothetical protein ACE5R6_06810 [Candidatus Heimdallarchaeota archaeon]
MIYISGIVLIGILALFPQLGYFIFNYISKKGLVRAQILEKSLYILSRERRRIFIGGIIVYEPCTIHEESALEFVHKILEYLPLTFKLVKSCDHSCIYVYTFIYQAKTNMKSYFDEKIHKIANILETLFTPRKIQIMTGGELYKKMQNEYGEILDTEEETCIITRKSFASIFELIKLYQRENWKQRIFLLNCLLELGLDISLLFTIRMKNTHVYSTGQIRINGNTKEALMEGIKILKKGGSSLLASSTSQKREKKDLSHELVDSALQIVPYLGQEINLKNFASLIQFCVQNASKMKKKFFSAPENYILTPLHGN